MRIYSFSLQILHCQSQATICNTSTSVALALESFAQLCLHKCLKQKESKQIQETSVAIWRKFLSYFIQL